MLFVQQTKMQLSLRDGVSLAILLFLNSPNGGWIFEYQWIINWSKLVVTLDLSKTGETASYRNISKNSTFLALLVF